MNFFMAACSSRDKLRRVETRTSGEIRELKSFWLTTINESLKSFSAYFPGMKINEIQRTTRDEVVKLTRFCHELFTNFHKIFFNLKLLISRLYKAGSFLIQIQLFSTSSQRNTFVVFNFAIFMLLK